MQTQLLIRYSLIVLASLLLPSFTMAQELKFKTCGKPLPLQLRPFTKQPQRIDFLCGNTGCFKGPANDQQNAMKNNLCAPATSLITVTLQTFAALGNASNSEPTIPKGEPPPSRTKLTNIITLENGT